MNYWAAFIVAFGLSLALTPLVRRLAFRYGAVDHPTGGRKIHARPTARWGGLAIAPAFVITVLLFLAVDRALLGLLGGAVIMLVMGLIDDRRPLNAGIKLFWQVVAAIVALAGGIGIVSLSKPGGGLINLAIWRSTVHIGSLHFHILPLANLLSIIWIVGMINAMNFLDGVDGLASGVSSIASFFIFLLALHVHQPVVALLALALSAATAGFLPANSFPASIFLADSGAYFLGLVLALLAIYSGGKLATAALVLGFAIIDGLLTVLRRLYHRQSPFRADRTHLHHLLLDFGLTQRQTVIVYYAMAVLLGLVALTSGTIVKLVAIAVLALATATLAAILIRRAPSR